MKSTLADFFSAPRREYAVMGSLALLLLVSFVFSGAMPFLAVVALLGALPTLWNAAQDLFRLKLTIDVFNSFAVVISFAVRDIRSAAFITLMLSFARFLDWYTDSRTSNAIEELLRLKPHTAAREVGGATKDIPIGDVKSGDVVVVANGARIPVDGIVVYGTAYVNEALVTGESQPVEKKIGDVVFGSTLNESGAIKVRASSVGADSTIERMVALMRDAASHKSRTEKVADRAAKVFLPLVGLFGLGVYMWTKDASMTAAIFLVACADDLAVSIPLAMTAALGHAAKRGVIIKGGEWLEVLSKLKIIVFDKTGTLTYGNLSVSDTLLAPRVDAEKFWRLVAAAEKFSEHPVGKAIWREAVSRGVPVSADPDQFVVHKGSGVWVRVGKDEVAIGNMAICTACDLSIAPAAQKKMTEDVAAHSGSVSYVFVNKKYAGVILVGDTPRVEAKQSIIALRDLGVERFIMFTGDREEVAREVSRALGISEYRAAMKPEAKLRELEALTAQGPLCMVGDGVNDAPALARADVSIAMGSGGAAVSVEAADVVIQSDDLSRIAEVVRLGRRTMRVVHNDVIIWVVTNAFGFFLVLTGVAGPALAAFYNFITDFFPLINSALLFRKKKPTK